MINAAQLENDMTEKMRSRLALAQLSEAELLRLLGSIAVLEVELKDIPSQEDNLFEAITAAQKLLLLWQGMVERIFTVKQAKNTRIELGNWDNEGGLVEHCRYDTGKV